MLRAAVAVLEVAAVVRDDEQRPADGDRVGGRPQDAPPFGRGNLQVRDEDEIVGPRLRLVAE
jgi:hypothetical protein